MVKEQVKAHKVDIGGDKFIVLEQFGEKGKETLQSGLKS
jgi:hypothetical protein